jgi:DNA polymerase I
MSGPTHSRERVPICDAERLAEGGFAADTEVMTTSGPQQVTALNPGAKVLALNPTTKVVKPKRLLDVETVDSPSRNIRIHTRRSDLLVSPDHRIPYTTKSIDRPRFIRSGALTDREAYQFINEWRPRSGSGIPQIDLTDHCSECEINAEFDVHGHTVQSMLPDGCDPCRQNTHTGYFFDPNTFNQFQNELEGLADQVTIHAGPNHWRRPYRFAGEDFIEFLGWFVTEGSVT